MCCVIDWINYYIKYDKSVKRKKYLSIQQFEGVWSVTAMGGTNG